MYGLQFNYCITAWSVGYVIGQIPGNMLLNRVSPHYIVFVMEFGWSILTLCTTWVKTWEQLIAIRFFVGLFESAYYPGLRELPDRIRAPPADGSLSDRIVVHQRRAW
jgi:ACS family pantothenate transporter-like MFS transporter